jgi:hypothetical protein
MKHSKLFSLVSSLPEKEVRLFSEALQHHKRDSLKRLFAILHKAGKVDEPGAEEVFKPVFGKKYSKANDYLLRNEYRLLYEYLKQQIHRQICAKEEFDVVELLAYFLEISAYELFEEEHNVAWKKALQEDNIDLLVQLSDLNINYYLSAKTQSLANAEQTIALSQQRINLLQTQFLRNVRKEEIRLKLSERIISAYKNLPQVSVPLGKVNLSELEKNDSYAQYLSKRAKVNFARGNEKIKLLKTILADEQLIRKYETAPEEALCRFLINLAQEYYLNSSFQDSVDYYKKAYSFFEQVSTPVRETLIFNYIMSLIRNNEFKTAEQLANANAELMLNSKVLASRSPFLLAVVNLYTRQADAAEKFVKFDAKKDGSEFYYFMRLVLSAVYYLRGDIDLALREAINLDQAVNYELKKDKNLQTQISKPIIAVFRRFYSIIQGQSRNMEKELKKLGEEMSSSLNSKTDQSPNSMLTQWLINEMYNVFNKSERRR